MTSEHAPRGKHEEALELARLGRHKEALAAIREHLLRCPLDGEALNDAGAMLYGLGRFDEAARHLRTALAQSPAEAAQVLENLAEVYLAAGRADETLALLEPLAGTGALTGELAGRTAEALLDGGDLAGATEALLRPAALSPQSARVGPLLADLRKLRPNVGIFCPPGRDGLLGKLHAFLAERFETRVYRGRDKLGLARFLHWCDVAWFDGCDELAAIASHGPKTCRLAVRVHPHEAYAAALERVNWPNVDLLAAAGSAGSREFLARRLPDVARAGRIRPLPRGLDAEPLPWADRHGGTNLACVDGLDLPGNAMLLLQCFGRLHLADGRFQLFFAGYFRDDALEAYVSDLLGELHLAGCVHFDGWQEDLPTWLADKHYVVSAATVETPAAGILEAMAMGLRPVLHCFPGSRDLYPPELLYRTGEEFCRRVLAEPFDSAAYRRFVCEHAGAERFVESVNALLVELEPHCRQACEPAVGAALADGAGP